MQNLKTKIAIVDDDAALTHEFEKILSDVGYEVQVYNSPQFNNASAHELPDAVLVDVWLHGEPLGLQEVKAIKRQKGLAQIPIILISSDPNVAEYAKSVRATAYLAKPLDPQELISTLDQILSH